MNRKKESIQIENLMLNGKIPPQAIDLEKAILGAVMLEKSAFDRCINIINTNDFYKDSHKEIFKSFQTLSKQNQPIDLLTVTNHLRNNGKLEEVGGPYFITSLTNNIYSAANIEYHAHIIKQHSLHRELISVLFESQSKAWEEGSDPFELVKQVSVKVDSLITLKNTDLISLSKAAQKVYVEIETQRQTGVTSVGYKSCLNEINKHLMGYTSPDLIVLAARPGEGKSTLALNEALNFAVKDIPTLFFSLEMKDRQLVWKMLSQTANINVLNIRSANLTDEQMEDLAYQVSKFDQIPFYMADGVNSLQAIKALARQSVKQNGVKAIVIDYLQLIAAPEIKADTREQTVSEITRQLKQLCIELDVPIILLSQLSRPQKGVTVKQPTLFDLKESGAIEANADVVVFIFRPYYHGSTNAIGWDGVQFDETLAIIDIAKQRLGSTGGFLCNFEGEYNRFVDLKTAYRHYETNF